jgi:hypothetical protein
VSDMAKRKNSRRESSEQGFIFPEDGLHKAMAALPWAVLRDMLFPQDRKGPRVQLKVPSDETRRKRRPPR